MSDRSSPVSRRDVRATTSASSPLAIAQRVCGHDEDPGDPEQVHAEHAADERVGRHADRPASG